MTRRGRLTTALLAAMLAAFMPTAAAKEHATDGEVWSHEVRNVEFEGGNDGFRYVSERITPNGHDRIEGTFDLLDGTFAFSYLDWSDEQRRPFHFNLSFVALTEFRDRNGNERYELGDELISYIPLRHNNHYKFLENDWDRMAPFEITATYFFQTQGRMLLSFVIPEEATDVAGHDLLPTEALLRVEIQDYVFSSNDTMLALETHTQTRVPGELENGGSTMFFQRGKVQTYYDWAGAESPDTSGSGPAGVTALEFKAVQDPKNPQRDGVVIFSFPQGESLTVSPVVGVQRSPSPFAEVIESIPGDWRLFATGLLGAILVIGAAALVKVRRSSVRQDTLREF